MFLVWTQANELSYTGLLRLRKNTFFRMLKKYMKKIVSKKNQKSNIVAFGVTQNSVQNTRVIFFVAISWILFEL